MKSRYSGAVRVNRTLQRKNQVGNVCVWKMSDHPLRRWLIYRTISKQFTAKHFESTDSTNEISCNESRGGLTAVSKISTNYPNLSPAPEQRVFENVSLQGIANIFNQQLGSAIRRVTVQDELEAAVATVFPIWAGTIDCLMSLEVSEWSVEWLAMALFNAKVKWVNQIQHAVLNEGVTLMIPNSEVTLKGVSDEAIVKVFGPEIHDAITESPIRRKELEEGMRVNDTHNEWGYYQPSSCKAFSRTVNLQPFQYTI
ncbi:hypothetical protein I7I48_10890 [Histoplasma ohiense]|nr:hypothetical protein I7I48_10890 [Histoplasma ohiense (nom. inval.)]